MQDRISIRRMLLRSRKEAQLHMDAICQAELLTFDVLDRELRQYILVKFLLTEADVPENDSFDAVVEKSLANSMNIHPALVEEFDTAKSCDGATSAMAKKVLLYMSMEKALGIQLPALESARVKTLADISRMVYHTMEQSSQWSQRLG